MKVKNIFVADVVGSICSVSGGNLVIERTIGLECRICKKTRDGYIDMETNTLYSSSSSFGEPNIVTDTITPLSDYYNVFGTKKPTKHSNKEKVYAKVDMLRRNGKL